MRQIGLWCMLALAGCSKGSSTESGEPKPDVPEAPAVAPPAVFPANLDKASQYQARERTVALKVGERGFEATLAYPLVNPDLRASVGLLLLAGSGPTDRDWNNPLLPGKNGSGRLLAIQLARSGVAVMRFDKAGTGKNPGPKPDQYSLDMYVDEGRAALAALRQAPELLPGAPIFIAGHSEGGIHATRLASAEGNRIGGVIYLSAPGRRMKDVLIQQLEGNFRDGARLPPAEVRKHMDPIRAAVDDFIAGKPVDPTKVSAIPQVQQLLASLVAPQSAALSRALLSFDPAAEAAKLEPPMLVINGGKDLQIDYELDARPLARAIERAGRSVSLQIVSDADHVLKHEPKTPAQLRADLPAVQNAYNADDRDLDPGVVIRVMDWIDQHDGR